MKAKPFKKGAEEDGRTIFRPCEPSEATHVKIRTPGPWPMRMLPVVQGNADRRGTPCWSWNGDVEKPTLKPSILTGANFEASEKLKCHSFVTDGKIEFLDDSTHEFAGQTMDLLDIEREDSDA